MRFQMRFQVRFLLLLVVLLTGCATGCANVTTLYRDAQGKVYRVETKGSVKTTIKQGDEEIIQDTKQEPLIDIKPEIPISKFGL